MQFWIWRLIFLTMCKESGRRLEHFYSRKLKRSNMCGENIKRQPWISLSNSVLPVISYKIYLNTNNNNLLIRQEENSEGFLNTAVWVIAVRILHNANQYQSGEFLNWPSAGELPGVALAAGHANDKLSSWILRPCCQKYLRRFKSNRWWASRFCNSTTLLRKKQRGCQGLWLKNKSTVFIVVNVLGMSCIGSVPFENGVYALMLSFYAT